MSSKCLAPVAQKLIPCVDYVDPASKKVKPPSNGVCCRGLKGFLNEDFDCLCSLVNVKPGDFPIPIDRLKILQLPGLCNATIPSFKCSGEYPTNSFIFLFTLSSVRCEISCGRALIYQVIKLFRRRRTNA